LLDTHVFLWWDSGAEKLCAVVRSAIADPGNNVFISAASVWEIAIKAAKKKLSFTGSPVAAITANGFLELPIAPRHAEVAGGLSWEHSDPFDRMLVAQAQTDSLILVHADGIISGYKSVPQLWARE